MNNVEFDAMQVRANAVNAVGKLRQIFVDSGIESACYALRIRVKDRDRVVEKVRRKSREKEDYNVYKITDVIGVRLIALFRAELPELLGKTLQLIKHHSELKPNPFKKESLEETILYTSEAKDASFNVLLRTHMNNFGIAFMQQYSEKGYSSLHLVCRLSHAVDFADPPNYFIPVEIQIRSVFEDAWGEIDHKYGYSPRSGKAPAFVDVLPALAPHLPVLKRFTDACAAYADTIRDIALSPSTSVASAGKVISVESDDDVIARFRQLAVHPSLIEDYIEGRRLRDESKDAGPQRRVAKYLYAASHFNDLSERAARIIDEGSNRLFWYYARMNLAFCLLSAGKPDHVRAAISIYDQLAVEFSTFPLVHFRLAQAYTKIGNSDSAIKLFEYVWEVETKIARACEQSGSWPDHLPLTDHNHISTTLPKLLGYAYWAKAIFEVEERDIAQQKALLRLAYERTREGYEDKPLDRDLANNLICYSLAYLGRGHRDNFSDQLSKDLPEYASVLEAIAEECDDVDILDTLLQLYTAQNRPDDAYKMAARMATQLAEADANEDTRLHPVISRVVAALRGTQH